MSNVTGATADAAGVVTVNFTVKNGTTPVTTIPSVGAGIFKLAPAGGGLSYNRWVPYIWRTETVVGTQDAAGNPFPKPAGYTVNQGYRESSGTGAANGTLVNNGGGSYTYTFRKNLATATLPDNVTLVGYDRALTHRVIVTMGGHNGPTGEGDLDFVPNGAAVTATRNIVLTATCKKCHGPEFAGHGGDRVTVEGCVACHSPDSKDAQSGESIEMAVMIHKIHAGNELAERCGTRRAVLRQSVDRLGRNRRQRQIHPLGQLDPGRLLGRGRLPGGARQLPGLPHRQRGRTSTTGKPSPPARRAVPAMTRSIGRPA